MSDPTMIFQLVNLAFGVAATALEREAVLARIKELELGGASPDEIRVALVAMRDEQLARAEQAAQAAAPGG